MSALRIRIPLVGTGFAILLLAAGSSIPAPAAAALTPSWITEGGQYGAMYGRSVSSAGDVNGDGYADLIVGAYLYENSGYRQGRAYVYYGSAAGLPTTPSWIAEATADDQGFGYSVAGIGDVNGDGYSDVAIGRALGSSQQDGHVWVYLGSAGGLGATPAWEESGVLGFGEIVVGAGDVNGDGYADLLVARSQESGGGIWIYQGSPGGLSHTAALTLGTKFKSIASAGDVNGDGYDDLIVGLGGLCTSCGAAEIFLGSAAGLSPTYAWSVKELNVGGHADNGYGVSVAGAGDVNGDGFDDFLVGASRYDSNNLTDTGRVFLYYGSAGVPDVYPEWVFDGNLTSAQIGTAVAAAGDVNGDGYADILVGASWFDYGTATQGRAYLFYGSAATPSPTPDWTVAGDQALADFAVVLGSAGDVNGDGGADIYVSADQYHHTQMYEGRAFIYTSSLVGVPHGPVVSGLALAPPSPNPSRGPTNLSYSLPARGRARLTVHDVMGRTVAVLVDAFEEAGPHAARWEGDRVPSGVYVARLEFAGHVETRRIAVTR